MKWRKRNGKENKKKMDKKGERKKWIRKDDVDRK